MPNMNDLPLMSSSHQSYIAVFIEYSLFFSATPIKGLHSPHRRGTDQSVLRSHDHPPHTWSRTSFSSLKTHGGYKNVRRGVDELNLINLLCLWYLTGHLNHLLIHVRYWSDHHTDIHIVGSFEYFPGEPPLWWRRYSVVVILRFVAARSHSNPARANWYSRWRRTRIKYVCVPRIIGNWAGGDSEP